VGRLAYRPPAVARHELVVVHHRNDDGFIGVRHGEVVTDTGTALRLSSLGALYLYSDLCRVGVLLIEVEDRVRELVRAAKAALRGVNDLGLVVSGRSARRLDELSSGLGWDERVIGQHGNRHCHVHLSLGLVVI